MTQQEHSAEGPSTQRPSMPPPGRGRFQFGMRGLMATMVLLCVPFAIWGGLLRAGKEPGDNSRLFVFVLLCVAAPMGVMVALGAAGAVARAYRRLRRR
jgi:hypothetical protein